MSRVEATRLLSVEVFNETVSGAVDRPFHHLHGRLRGLLMQACQGHLRIGLECETPPVRIFVEHCLSGDGDFSVEWEKTLTRRLLPRRFVQFSIGSATI